MESSTLKIKYSRERLLCRLHGRESGRLNIGIFKECQRKLAIMIHKLGGYFAVAKNNILNGMKHSYICDEYRIFVLEKMFFLRYNRPVIRS